eukprot:3764838-Rhodomonas_salina.4
MSLPNIPKQLRRRTGTQSGGQMATVNTESMVLAPLYLPPHRTLLSVGSDGGYDANDGRRARVLALAEADVVC